MRAFSTDLELIKNLNNDYLLIEGDFHLDHSYFVTTLQSLLEPSGIAEEDIILSPTYL